MRSGALWLGCAVGLIACNAVLGNEEPRLVGGDAGSSGSGALGNEGNGAPAGSASDGASGAQGDEGGAPSSTATGSSGATPKGGASGAGGGGGSGGGGSGPTSRDGGAAGMGEAGAGGMGDSPPTGPYAPREGTFQMLLYSRTAAFRHASIDLGIALIHEIATEHGFSVTATETNERFTPTGLDPFELVFFLHTSGDVLTVAEQNAFESWMRAEGAWVGTHSAADTEAGWPFYLELIGQQYGGHGLAGTAGSIDFDPDYLNHPALQNLPDPWPLSEEWWNFPSYASWQDKPGFQILGRKGDGQPIVWCREDSTYRSFYTGIGHAEAAFANPDVKKHLTGAILWSVRRGHWL